MADMGVKVRLDADGNKLVGQVNAAAAAADKLGDEVQEAGTKAAAAADNLTRAGKGADNFAAGAQQATRSVGQMRAGSAQLGFQIQDITQGLAMGVNPMVVFGQQAGQTASAVALMGGRFAKVGTFLAGPWGSLILAGVTVVGLLASELLFAGDTAEEAEGKAIDFADGLSVLEVQALNTADGMKSLVQEMQNAIAVQGDFLRSNALAAQSQVDNVRLRLDANASELRRLEQARSGVGATLLPGLFGPSGDDLRREQQLRQQIEADRALLPQAERAAGLAEMATAQQRVNESLDEAAAATGRYERAVGELNQRRQATIDDPLADNGIGQEQYEKEFKRLTELRDAELEAARESERASKRRAGGRDKAAAAARREAREAKRLADFGAGAAESIQRINERFSDQPKLVTQVAQATRQLDDIMADLAERQPEGFQELIAQANEAKAAVQDSLSRPFDEMQEDAQRQLNWLQLILAGREDEAEALQRIYDLQDRVGQVTADQRDIILENVEAERELNELLQQRSEAIQAYQSSIQGVRGELEALLGGASSPGDFLKGLKANFQQLQGRLLTEKLFGPMLRELDEYVRQNTGIATGVDIMKEGTEKAGTAATDMAGALERAEARVDQLFTGGGAVPGGSDAFNAAFSGDWLNGGTDAVAQEIATGTQEIVVTGKRLEKGVMGLSPEQYFDRMARDLAGPLLDGFDDIFGTQFFGRLTSALGGVLSGYARGGLPGGILGGARGLFEEFGQGLFGLGDQAFENILGGFDKALGGAQIGSLVSGIIGGSQTGAQVGGALGSFLPIPGGNIIGSVVGSVLFGLFKKKKYGTATLTGAGDPSVRGNKGSFRDTAGSLGGAVLDGLEGLAEQLDAEVGSFRVSIGQYKDNFRVSTTGRTGKLKAKYSDVTDFGDDSEAAIRFAIADAIRDGAIQGLSAAQDAALRSSQDLDEALSEVFKVRDLERALESFGETAQRTFREFEREAEERLRIARQYGLDVQAVEELNAEERLKLRERLEQEAYGSLQDLLERMRSGDLFEGSAVDRRQALLGQIDDATQRAMLGEEGAADELANLLQDFNQVSREVFGTTGGFAEDRSAIIQAAEGVIAAIGLQLDAADPNAPNPQLDDTNGLLDEANDTLREILEALLSGQGSGTGSGGGTTPTPGIETMAYTGGSGSSGGGGAGIPGGRVEVY